LTLHLVGEMALTLAAAFAGTAFYVGFAEHPARLGLDDASGLKQWKPSYAAGYTMQASLAALSGALGLLAAWMSHDWRWLIGATLILSNWPYTLIAMMPTNQKLQATALAGAGLETRHLLERWGRRHALRTALGIAAAVTYLWAVDRT
jgi:hypothetical protein